MRGASAVNAEAANEPSNRRFSTCPFAAASDATPLVRHYRQGRRGISLLSGLSLALAVESERLGVSAAHAADLGASPGAGDTYA
jgi:hypothetical protein